MLQARIAESPGGSVNGELMDRLQQQFSEVPFSSTNKTVKARFWYK